MPLFSQKICQDIFVELQRSFSRNISFVFMLIFNLFSLALMSFTILALDLTKFLWWFVGDEFSITLSHDLTIWIAQIQTNGSISRENTSWLFFESSLKQPYFFWYRFQQLKNLTIFGSVALFTFWMTDRLLVQIPRLWARVL